jgi:hypothetical protein
MVERALDVGAQPDQAALELQRSHSLRRALVEDVTRAALKHFLATAQDVQAFTDLAWRGLRVVDSVEYSVTDFDSSEYPKHGLNWNFWRHSDQPHLLIKAQKFPYIDRFGIEAAATSYLDLPFRAPLLERTIVDILIALELYAFSKEMLEKPPVGLKLPPQSPLMEKHALRGYLEGQFWSGVILLGIAFLVGTVGPRFIGQTAPFWIAGILTGLFIVVLVLSTVLLPFVWRFQRKARKQVRDLMVMMAHTYSELSGSGQVSTRRLREVAAKAADSGVVWPKPLFLILDENIARVGRI